MGRSVEAVMGTLRSVRHPEGGWVGRRGSRAWADRSVGLDLWRSRTPSREHGRRELEAQAPKSALLVTLAKSARRRTVWPWPRGAWAPAFTRRLARRPRSSGCDRRSRTRRGRASPELGSARWRRDGSGAFPAVAGRRVEIAAAWIEGRQMAPTRRRGLVAGAADLNLQRAHSSALTPRTPFSAPFAARARRPARTSRRSWWSTPRPRRSTVR